MKAIVIGKYYSKRLECSCKTLTIWSVQKLSEYISTACKAAAAEAEERLNKSIGHQAAEQEAAIDHMHVGHEVVMYHMNEEHENRVLQLRRRHEEETERAADEERMTLETTSHVAASKEKEALQVRWALLTCST